MVARHSPSRNPLAGGPPRKCRSQPVHSVSRKLILLIKAGYWLALLIIAAMVMASFVLLQQTMAAQQHNDTLLDIVSTQKALSQRIVFLAGATGAASARQAAGAGCRAQAGHRGVRDAITICCSSRRAPIRCRRHGSIRNRSRACFSPAVPTSIISRSG